MKKQKVTEHELRKIVSTCEINADLNYLDVSEIVDMSDLFWHSKFNGDISNWDVSSVIDMRYMFQESKFNGDISKWDVSNLKNMLYMFYDSKFNGDISNWNVSKVECMVGLFAGSDFNGDISKWKFHENVDKTQPSLARLIKLGQEYKEKATLLSLFPLNNLLKATHKPSI